MSMQIEHPVITAVERDGWPQGAAQENRGSQEDQMEFAQDHFDEFLAFAEDGDVDLLERFAAYMGQEYRDWLN